MSPNLSGTTPDALEVAAEIHQQFAAAGATGSFLARNVRTGQECGFNPTQTMPLASLVKVPIALVVLDLIEQGVLDASEPVRLDPAVVTPGANGLSAFRHEAMVALGDLLYLMLAVSDNAAADLIIDRVGLDTVRQRLQGWDCSDIVVRHRMRAMYDSVAMLSNDDVHLAMELAIRGTTGTGAHPLPVLDVAEANAGTARVLVDLLERIWLDQISHPNSTRELRRLLAMQVSRHRLPSELSIDTIDVSSKTGTFLNLRHEIGMIQPDTGELIAVAALTASTVASRRQPELEYAIGSAARKAVELLR